METIPRPTKYHQKLALDSVEELKDTLSKIEGAEVDIEVEQTELHIKVPKSAMKLLLDILSELSQGRSVSVIPHATEVTTQVAADILNVSRPYLIKLLEQGEIPFTLVGRHRRIKHEDVQAYKVKMKRKQRELLAEMMQTDEKYGLYDTQ